MMKNNRLVSVSGVLAAALAGLFGCISTTPYAEQDENPSVDSDIATLLPTRHWLAGQILNENFRLSDLSRIELAEISENLVVTEPGSRNFVVHKASAKPYVPAAAQHEKYADGHVGNETGWQKHLNRISTDARPLTSVAQELPPGWVATGDSVIHQNSGLNCPRNWQVEDTEYSLLLTRLHQFDEKSLDVGCTFQSNTEGVVTLFATYAPNMSQDDHAIAAAQQIAEQFQTDKVLPVPVATITDDSGQVYEEPSAVGFDITPQNSLRSMKSSLWLVKTGGWHVKARATHLMDDTTTELSAVVLFALAHATVRAKNIDAPLGGTDV